MSLSDLPIELLQHIALSIPSNKDLSSFAAVCRSARGAVYRDGDSFWFQRFRAVYDRVRHSERMANNTQYKELYQKRHKVMAIALSGKQLSKRGDHKTKWPKAYLQMLIGLIDDAAPGNDGAGGEGRSKNAVLLTKHAYESGLMSDVLRFERQSSGNQILKTVQLVLSHLAFRLCGPDKKPCFDMHNFPESQKVVYASETGIERQPMFWDAGKQQVNIDFALHCVNFFKHHLTREVEHTGWPEYSALAESRRPSQWQPQAEADVGKLGRSWIGTYSYLEHRELYRIRHCLKRDETFFQDKHIDEGHNVLQNMEIDFVQEGQDHFYPDLFDEILNPSKYHGAQVQHRSKATGCGDQKIRFTGSGEDEEAFATTGYLTPLPPQNGVSGFCRVVMMKYFYLEDDVTIATDSLWAYEGVVLPGGQMMVGRWWAADDGTRAADMYSGPFIFWNVPDEPASCVERLLAGSFKAQTVPKIPPHTHVETAAAAVPVSSKDDAEASAQSCRTSSVKDAPSASMLQSDDEATEDGSNLLLSPLNSPTADGIGARIYRANVAVKDSTVKTPRTPTTPLLGMSLNDLIDLTASPDEPAGDGRPHARGLPRTLDRVDTPILSGFAVSGSFDSRPSTVPKVTGYTHSEKFWDSRGTYRVGAGDNDKTGGPGRPSAATNNAADMGHKILESIKTTKTYSLPAERGAGGAEASRPEKTNGHVGVLHDQWGYNKPVTTSKGGPKAARRR